MRSYFLFLMVIMAIFFISCGNSTKKIVDSDAVGTNPDTEQADTLVSNDKDDIQNDKTAVTDGDTITGDDNITDTWERPDGDTVGAACQTIYDCAQGFFCKRPAGSCTAVGVCEVRPDETNCGVAKAPVCGCDMQNYQNDCWANSAGVNVQATGTCPESAACSGDGINGGCKEGSFCRPLGEVCGGEGYCQLIPLECSDTEYPVCACDDKTYKSRCFAEMARQPILHQNECGTMNPCKTNQECFTEEFCAKPAGTCSDTAPGKCDLRPADCYMARAIIEVCGCDGNSYNHPCWAGFAGTVVAKEGKCAGDVFCGDNNDCAKTEYCRKTPGMCDMGEGVCRPRPPDCPSPEEQKPVCGCDLKDYSDACQADISNAFVKHNGECTGPDDSVVSYFYANNAESMEVRLRIIKSPTDIVELTAADAAKESIDTLNDTVTFTVRFYSEENTKYGFAEAKFTIPPQYIPYGTMLDDENYIKLYDWEGTELLSLYGMILVREYKPGSMNNDTVDALTFSGKGLTVKE